MVLYWISSLNSLNAAVSMEVWIGWISILPCFSPPDTSHQTNASALIQQKPTASFSILLTFLQIHSVHGSLSTMLGRE